MGKEDTYGRIRLCMRVVFGWIREKGKEKYSILMRVGMKGTGEMTREKVKGCCLKIMLQ